MHAHGIPMLNFRNWTKVESELKINAIVWNKSWLQKLHDFYVSWSVFAVLFIVFAVLPTNVYSNLGEIQEDV